MGETTRTVDLNAHVNNIECQIETANNIAKAVIAFDNLGYGTITAIKFIAQGFNSFGDAVKVNGQDKFFLIIQDISIEKNCHAENLRATLPNGDIRKLILEESQICYADGTVSTYSGRNDCSFTLQTIEEDDIEAVRDEYNDQFEYMPIELDAAWVCGCGRCNGRDEAVCSNCGSEKEHVLQLSTPDYISELKVKHEAKEQERKEQAAAEEAQKAKARKKRIIKIGIICVAVAIYIVFNWNINILSNRTTYNSAAEMKTALQGTYTHYYMGETVSQLVISGDKATWVFNDGQTIEKDIEKWNYKRGIVRTSESPLVVNKAGNLERGNTVYKKGQFKTPTSKNPRPRRHTSPPRVALASFRFLMLRCLIIPATLYVPVPSKTQARRLIHSLKSKAHSKITPAQFSTQTGLMWLALKASHRTNRPHSGCLFPKTLMLHLAP